MDDDLDVGDGSHILTSVSRSSPPPAATLVIVAPKKKPLWGFTYTKNPLPGESKFQIVDEVRLTVLVLMVCMGLCAFGFLIADLGMGRITLTDAYNESGHGLAVIIGGVFALLASALSAVQVKAHWKHWTHPPSQRLVVRILYMVPIYALSAWMSLTFLDLSAYIDFIRSCYEAFVIYTFMILLTKYLGGHQGVVECMQYKQPQPWPSPMYCMKPVKPDSRFLYYLKYGTLQYTILMPICALATVVLSTFGAYSDGVIAYDNGYAYITAIVNCSQVLSLYCLVWLYVCMKNELAPFGPGYKFIVVKSVVFATFWQGVALAVMVKFGWITGTSSFTVSEVQVGIQDFAVCCLAFGTKVCYADGRIGPAEEVKEGDRLLGVDSRPVTVAAVQYPKAQLYRIFTSDGSYDVTASHLLTLMWCRSPNIAIAPVSSLDRAAAVDPTHTHDIRVTYVTFDGRDITHHTKSYPCAQPIDGVHDADDSSETEVMDLGRIDIPEFFRGRGVKPEQRVEQILEAKETSHTVQNGSRTDLLEFGRARLAEIRASLASQDQPELMLLRGDLFDMTVTSFMKAWDNASFCLADPTRRQITSVRVPLPIVCDTENTTNSDKVHTECTLLALGAENGKQQYKPIRLAQQAEPIAIKIGYQVGHSVTSTFLNLSGVHDALGIQVTKDTGLVACEISPIATDDMHYDTVCQASILSMLSQGVTSFVAFGQCTRAHWQRDIRTLHDPTGNVQMAHVEESTLTFAGQQMEQVIVPTMQVTYTLHGVTTICTVFFSEHPCSMSHLQQVAASVGLAHGLTFESVQARLSHFSTTGSYQPHFTQKPHLLDDEAQSVVNIVCAGDRESEKRYTIVSADAQHGTLTHNCEMFLAACMHKYTFGAETYADGSIRLIMEQRALYLAEQSYKRAAEAQKEAQRLEDELAQARDPSLRGTIAPVAEETPEEAAVRQKAMAAVISRSIDDDTEDAVLFDEDEVDWTTGDLPIRGGFQRSSAYDFVYAYELDHQRAEGVDDVDADAAGEMHLRPIPMTDVDFGIEESPPVPRGGRGGYRRQRDVSQGEEEKGSEIELTVRNDADDDEGDAAADLSRDPSVSYDEEEVLEDAPVLPPTAKQAALQQQARAQLRAAMAPAPRPTHVDRPPSPSGTSRPHAYRAAPPTKIRRAPTTAAAESDESPSVSLAVQDEPDDDVDEYQPVGDDGDEPNPFDDGSMY